MQIGAVGFIESMITCTLLLILSGLDLTCLCYCTDILTS